jgi:hypothetical protein
MDTPLADLMCLGRLGLGRGWPLDQIRMEPSFPEFPNLSWAVDILLKDKAGDVVAGCEVKRDERELRQLVAGFRHCCARGAHSKGECHFAKNHPKYEFCTAIKPAYFMAAARGREISFRLAYDGTAIAIIEEGDHLIACA